MTFEMADETPGASADRLQRTELAGELSFLLARANALSMTAANVALAAHGLRVRSYSVLALAAAGTNPSQRELADFLRLDPSQIVAIIDDLQRAGLVERRPDPRDRRANVLVATREGLRAHHSAQRSARIAEDGLYAAMDAESRARLTDALRVVAFPSDG